MLGWIFLGLTGAGIGWLLLTDYAGIMSAIAGALGFSFEPLTGTSLFTDWLTWAIGDIAGWLMLGGMGMCALVLIVNASRSGDLIQ